MRGRRGCAMQTPPPAFAGEVAELARSEGEATRIHLARAIEAQVQVQRCDLSFPLCLVPRHLPREGRERSKNGTLSFPVLRFPFSVFRFLFSGRRPGRYVVFL